MVQKIKPDPKAALRRQAERSTASAVDRFAIAQQVTQQRPSGLAATDAAPVETTAVSTPVPSPAQVANPASARASALPAGMVARLGPNGAFDITKCVVGATVEVPLSYIDANPLSPRQIYRSDDIDRIAETLPEGQDVAAAGYVAGGRVKLIDGGTRLRAARITDRGVLEVKFEAAPGDDLALFERARAFNERRSPTTALDFALSLRLLIERKALARSEIIEKVKGPDGSKLSEAAVSRYLRVARMPDKVQRAMADSAETSTLTALYAVSEMFVEGQDEAALETAIESALEIVEEVKRRKLNRNQIISLVKAKLEGPKTRERASALPLEFGHYKGHVKVFGKKGQIDLSMNGLAEDELPEVRNVLVEALESYMKAKAGKTPAAAG